MGKSSKTAWDSEEDNIKLLELQPEWTIFGDMLKDFIHGANV